MSPQNQTAVQRSLHQHPHWAGRQLERHHWSHRGAEHVLWRTLRVRSIIQDNLLPITCLTVLGTNRPLFMFTWLLFLAVKTSALTRSQPSSVQKQVTGGRSWWSACPTWTTPWERCFWRRRFPPSWTWRCVVSLPTGVCVSYERNTKHLCVHDHMQVLRTFSKISACLVGLGNISMIWD